MSTRKFSKEILTKLLYNTPVEDNGVLYRKIQNVIKARGGQLIDYNLIFSVRENNETTFWSVWHSVRVVECQNRESFEGQGKEVVCYKVIPTEKTITMYVPE